MTIEELQKELEDVNTSYTQLQEYCRDINEKKADLEETNKYLESEKSDLEEKYAQMTEELNQLREQYQTSQEQCRSLQEQLESGASSGDNLGSRNQLLDEINMVEKELEKVTKERDQLMEKNKALQANTRPAENSGRLAEYEQKLEDKEKQVSELQNEIGLLNEKVDELVKQLKDAQNREEKLEKSLSTNEIKNESLTDDDSHVDFQESRISYLKNAFESGKYSNQENQSDLLSTIREKDAEIERLRQQLKESKPSVSINLPPLHEGEAMACPPPYLDALSNLRQWYKSIETRL